MPDLEGKRKVSYGLEAKEGILVQCIETRPKASFPIIL